MNLYDTAEQDLGDNASKVGTVTYEYIGLSQARVGLYEYLLIPRQSFIIRPVRSWNLFLRR